MSAYVLVGSQDPFESTDGRRLYQLAGDLSDHGDEVTVFLVQNGVLACRPGSAAAGDVQALTRAATVLADDFSLRERGISAGEVVKGVRVGGIDDLVDAAMDDGRKVVWF